MKPSGLYRVKTVDGVKQFQAFGGTQVPSFPSVPVGAIIALYTTTVPVGYLPCNGAEYDTEQFPLLYGILNSNKLPDLRECTLVGVGENDTDTIETHDTYFINQFKDDQVQDHKHDLTDPGHFHNFRFGDGNNGNYIMNDGYQGRNQNTNSSTTGITIEGVKDAYRKGTVTHGKQKGVYYVIKATSAINDVESNAEVSNAIALAAESLKNYVGYSSVPIGTVISLNDNSYTPDAYVKCDGSTYDVNKYPMLYKKLGTNKAPLIYDEILPENPNIAFTNYTNGNYTPSNIQYKTQLSTGFSDYNLLSTQQGFANDGYLYIETYHWYYLWIQDTDGTINGYMVGSRDDTQVNMWLPVKKGQKIYGWNRHGAASPSPDTEIVNSTYTKVYVWYYDKFKYIKATTGIEDNTTESEQVVDATSVIEQTMQSQYDAFVDEIHNQEFRHEYLLYESSATTVNIAAGTVLNDSLLNYDYVKFYIRRGTGASNDFNELKIMDHALIQDCLTSTGTYSVLFCGYSDQYRELKFNATADTVTAVTGGQVLYRIVGVGKRS